MNYAWDFGDGSISTEEFPGHIYSEVGTYTATLTVTDDNGATASNSLLIVVADTDVGCVTNCIAIDRINLSYRAKTKQIIAQVFLVDEHGNLIVDALLRAAWILPDKSTIAQDAETRTRGRARYAIKAGAAGTYRLMVSDMFKAGYSFDPDSSNVLSGMIDIAP